MVVARYHVLIGSPNFICHFDLLLRSIRYTTYLCMARARRSLSPTAASLLASKHKTTPTLPEHRTERGSGFDLEDGEITDEGKLEDTGEAAMEADDAVVSASGAETGPETLPLPSNPASEGPRSSSVPAGVEQSEPPASYPEPDPQKSEPKTPSSVPDSKAPSACMHHVALSKTRRTLTLTGLQCHQKSSISPRISFSICWDGACSQSTLSSVECLRTRYTESSQTCICVCRRTFRISAEEGTVFLFFDSLYCIGRFLRYCILCISSPLGAEWTGRLGGPQLTALHWHRCILPLFL